MSRKTFFDRELECQYVFDQFGPFYHLFTPGEETGDIFLEQSVKEFGLNLLGICSLSTKDFKIVAYSEMTDHLHVLYAGKKESGNTFFSSYFQRLRRILGSSNSLAGFKPKILPLPDLRAVRSEIAYINRNGYVINPDHTPFSYPWGSGILYFNPFYDRIPTRPFSSLTRDEKRVICRSRDINLPPGFSVIGNLIAPSEYCHARDIGMRLFRDAHHYFNLLSKDYEAYSAVAKRLGESVFIPDEEMFSVARSVCVKKYGVNAPSLLKPDERIDLAKILHSEYNANAKQLSRILKLDKRIVNELFPTMIEK